MPLTDAQARKAVPGEKPYKLADWGRLHPADPWLAVVERRRDGAGHRQVGQGRLLRHRRVDAGGERMRRRLGQPRPVERRHCPDAAATLSEGAAPGEADVEAVHAWALVHGLATLMLDGQIPADENLIDRVVSYD